MARNFRERAGETRYCEYIRMMTRTAADLEALAEKLESSPDAGRHSEVLAGFLWRP